MPPPIRELADHYLYDPAPVKVKSATLTVDSVEQFQLEVKTADKAEKLVEVLAAERPDQAIVFARTKIRTDQLYRKLRDSGMNVKALHGDMSQGSRDGVMLGFKGGRVPILVATDVAARGLDISTVTHVVNFDVPTLARRLRAPHRPHRPRRPLRPCDHVRRAAPEGELEAIERHIGMPISHVAARRARRARARSRSAHAATPSRSSRATVPRSPTEAHRQRRPGRRHRGRRPRPRGDPRGRDRRRGGARREGAGALRAVLGARPTTRRIVAAVDGERAARHDDPRRARQAPERSAGDRSPVRNVERREGVTLWQAVTTAPARYARRPRGRRPPAGARQQVVVPDFALPDVRRRRWRPARTGAWSAAPQPRAACAPRPGWRAAPTVARADACCSWRRRRRGSATPR